MPSVSETITIAAPLTEVWPLLSDPATVASCIPGATLSPEKDGDAWKGSIRVKFGPTVAIFKGEALLTYDHAAHTVTIEGRGIDGRGASRALANGLVSASGTSTTELSVSGDYSVSGPLETFANAGGVHVARALLAEFAKNMGALVEEQRSGGSASTAPASEQPQAAPPTATPSTATAAATPVAAPATIGSAPAAQPAPANGPCFVIADTRIKDDAAFALYRQAASDSVAAHGGRYMVRGGASRDLEGNWNPERMIVIAFPTRGAAETWYASSAYANAKQHAAAAFTRNLLIVDGLPNETLFSNAPATQTRPAAATPATPRPAPRQAAELNATALLWAAFKSWISSLFGKRS